MTQPKPKRGSIRVTNKRYGIGPKPDDAETILSIDRTNPILGNRHHLRNVNDLVERDKVIAKHKRDLDADLASNGPMSRELEKIAARVAAGEEICLDCWCAPRACHGDSYAAHINALVAKLRTAQNLPAPESDKETIAMNPSASITVREHNSSSYAPRTYHNAENADLTLALAVDFTTAGERLTRKAAGDRFISVALDSKPEHIASELVRALRRHNVQVLNCAGNGIYTLALHGWTQERVNAHVHEVLALAHKEWPLKKIISGGQTGIDIAGLIAGHALGIPVEGMLPRGFLQRATDKIDRHYTAAMITAQITQGAAALIPQAVATQEPVKLTCFWGKQDPFSNWHEAPFILEGKTFRWNEQYMMYKKAELFGDTEMAEKIMVAPSPDDCKRLGRDVRGYVDEIWVANRQQVVLDGCRAKFTQYPSLAQFLLDSGDTLLVEASPYDKIWGVGLAANDPRIQDPAKWPGLNLLGKVLTTLRNELRLTPVEAPQPVGRVRRSFAR